MQQADVVILGAGAAGLFAAFTAGRRGRSVLVLDHADAPGKKILISGGGRANFTNLHATPENYLCANPHFARSALARYTPQDFVALVEAHNIPWHEKTLGQLFCTRSARDLLNLLLAECAATRVRVQLSTRIDRVLTTAAIPSGAPGFLLETSAGPIRAASLIVATGGLSIPKLGATDLGYRIATHFGHTLVPPRPALVPLTLAPDDLATWAPLSGLSTHVLASTSSTSKAHTPVFPEKALLTHRGLSGPAILQISSYWRPGATISLDLAPHQAVFTAPSSARDPVTLLARLRVLLPARLAERWLALHLPPGSPRQLSNATLAALESALHAFTLTPSGTEGFPKAEVTAGGVSTGELNPQTLASRIVPGLFFVGEVVDVTGWLGGYNFQWAWASAHAAGSHA